MLNLVILLLYRQRNEESKNLKLNLKKELDCNFVDSDREEDDEDDNKNSLDDDVSKHFQNDIKPEVK